MIHKLGVRSHSLTHACAHTHTHTHTHSRRINSRILLVMLPINSRIWWDFYVLIVFHCFLIHSHSNRLFWGRQEKSYNHFSRNFIRPIVLSWELVTQENVTLHLGLGRELWSTGLLSGLHLHAFKDHRERNINALVVSMKLEKKML